VVNGVSPGDPDGKAMFFQPGGIVNFADYNNEVAWGRIEDSRTTLDQAERAQAWADLVAIQLEDAPYVWVGNIPVIVATRTRVHGDRILLFGSDYPHFDFDDPRKTLTRLPDKLRRRIFGESALETFPKLRPPE